MQLTVCVWLGVGSDFVFGWLVVVMYTFVLVSVVIERYLYFILYCVVCCALTGEFCSVKCHVKDMGDVVLWIFDSL